MKALRTALVSISLVLVLGGLGATVWELRQMNKALESLQTEGIWVHGARRDTPVSLRGQFGTIQVMGDVGVTGRVGILNQNQGETHRLVIDCHVESTLVLV